MAQYNIGSVAVTNGSQVVTGASTLWTANISAGDIFTLINSAVWYEVATVDSNTQITLAASYAAVTAASLQYTITRDFTPVLGLPYPVTGDLETAAIVKRAFLQLDSGITVSSFTHRGDWLVATAYVKDDAVLYLGRYFVSKQAGTGQQPPASPSTGDAYWGLVSDRGADTAQTSADVITTNANVVLTNADVSSTGNNAAASEVSATNAAGSATNAAGSEAIASTAANNTVNHSSVLAQGTATSGNATSITDSAAVFDVNAFMGTNVVIERAGVPVRTAIVLSNTKTSLSLNADVVAQSGDTYRVVSLGRGTFSIRNAVGALIRTSANVIRNAAGTLVTVS